jgi:tetratricopeptide (TPR) repeat protein
VASMSRLASFATIPEGQLDRLIKRIAVVLVVGALVFIGFYIYDRWRMPAANVVDRTIAGLEAAVRANPADVVARGQLGDAYLAGRRYADAVAMYDAILASGNEHQLAYFGRARAYHEMGNLAAARLDFQTVVDIARGGEMAHVDPLLNAAFYGLGAIALDEANPADAIQYLSAAIVIKRSDADSMNLLGLAYVRNGEPAKAIEPLRRAIAFVPLGWGEPYATLAEAYGQTGEPALASWAGAMAALSAGNVTAAAAGLQALVDGPAALEATIGLAVLNEREGDAPAAADWYRKALAIDPQNAEALLGLKRVAVPDASVMPALPTPGTGGGINP